MAGSGDTVHSHSFKMAEDHFHGLRSGNSKIIVETGEQVYLTIDTGESENILSSHHFDLNQRHSDVDLIKMPRFSEVADDGKKEADIKINA